MSAVDQPAAPASTKSFWAQIRDLLDAAPDGLTCAAVGAAFPGQNVGVALGSMFRSGMLTRSGANRRYIYRNARPVEDRVMGLSREAMHARRNDLARERYANRDPEAHAAYLAKRRKNRPPESPRPARPPRRRRAAAAAVEAAAPAAQVTALAATAAKATTHLVQANPAAMVIAPPSAESFTACPPAPKPRAETVAEWMARTGQQPEQLAGFQRVQPYTRQPVRSF